MVYKGEMGTNINSFVKLQRAYSFYKPQSYPSDHQDTSSSCLMFLKNNSCLLPSLITLRKQEQPQELLQQGKIMTLFFFINHTLML